MTALNAHNEERRRRAAFGATRAELAYRQGRFDSARGARRAVLRPRHEQPCDRHRLLDCCPTAKGRQREAAVTWHGDGEGDDQWC